MKSVHLANCFYLEGDFCGVVSKYLSLGVFVVLVVYGNNVHISLCLAVSQTSASSCLDTSEGWARRGSLARSLVISTSKSSAPLLTIESHDLSLAVSEG